MEELKATIIKLYNEKLHPNKPLLTPSQISAIEKKLHFVFPVFETPTHPTYSVVCILLNLLFLIVKKYIYTVLFF